MDIQFRSTKMMKEFNNEKLCVRRNGPERAKLIRRRLDEFRAAEVLEDMASLPRARCHELKGDRAGQLSVDLDQPYRLIVEPADDPVPRKPDGGLDWSRITVIRILEIADTHG